MLKSRNIPMDTPPHTHTHPRWRRCSLWWKACICKSCPSFCRVSWILFIYFRSDRTVSQQRTVSITASYLSTLVPQKPFPSVSCHQNTAEKKTIIISWKAWASCSKCSWLWVKQQEINWGYPWCKASPNYFSNHHRMVSYLLSSALRFKMNK